MGDAGSDIQQVGDKQFYPWLVEANSICPKKMTAVKIVNKVYCMEGTCSDNPDFSANNQLNL